MIGFEEQPEDDLQLKRTDSQQREQEIKAIFQNFHQFSSGVVHPWETVLEMDEDAEDGSIIWTKKFKLFLNEQGKQLLMQQKSFSSEDKSEWKFY